MYECACGDSYTASEIAKLEHSYIETVTAPSCTEQGYTTYSCSHCGDVYVSAETKATGHNYKSTVTTPTCTMAGHTQYTCETCGYTYTGNKTKALGHNPEDWVVTVEPTTESAGTRIKKCTRCDETCQTETIEKLEVDQTALQEKYDRAKNLLRYQGGHYYFSSIAEDLKEAYELFVSLGDYLDAKEYVEHFIVVPDVILHVMIDYDYGDWGEIDYYHYNEHGGVIKIMDSLGYVLDSKSYVYDDAGNIIEANTDSAVTRYLYDDKNRLSTTETIDSNGEITVCEYIYDPYGSLIQLNTYHDGYLEEWIEYTNDEHGRMISSKKFWAPNDGVVATIVDSVYFYDDAGKLVTVESTQNDWGEITHYWIEKYTYGIYYYHPSIK